MKDSQNQTLLTEETFAEMIKDKLDMAYMKGYNDACDIFSTVLLSNSTAFGDPMIKEVVEGLALTIKQCKLREEEGVILNG